MKKMLFVIAASFIVFLGGCSFLDEAQNLINYISEATEFLNKATDYANEAPELARVFDTSY